MAQYRAAGSGPRTKAVQRLNIAINNLVTVEDELAVTRVQRGSGNPGLEFGPISQREVAVGWFADKLREALPGTAALDQDVARV